MPYLRSQTRQLTRRIWPLFTTLSLLMLAACDSSQKADRSFQEAPDRILYNGVVYTADHDHSVVEALAIKADRILATGSNASVKALAGKDTQLTDLNGSMVLPGLHDDHIHPFGIIEIDQCDLKSQPVSLTRMVELLKDCVQKYHIAPGAWLTVQQWNFAEGNEPSAGYPTLLAALDAVSTQSPIILYGNDGHHGAANSLALSRARHHGEVIGIDKLTLADEFADYRPVIGTDADGNPNGQINEGARYLIDPPPVAGLGVDPSIKPHLAEISEKLARFGITSVMDAATSPEALDYYGELEASGRMTFRLTAALFPDWKKYTNSETGNIDIDAILKRFIQARNAYASSELIKADMVKVFVDGVIEGNPLASPPTLPNAAVLKPYEQPLFAFDTRTNSLSLEGYVDLNSEDCWEVRNSRDLFETKPARTEFIAKHGFLPEQCSESRGVLEHPESFYADYFTRMDAADFGVHAHVIGDRAMRVALDAFAAAKKTNGNRGNPMGLAHAQLIAPEDIPRIGQLNLYVAFTYGWILPNESYDLTVVPFIDHLSSISALYNPENYSYKFSYPVKSVQGGGAMLVAGSDAPVDSRDPSPFFHIEQAITRANDQGEVLNPTQRIDLESVLDAYTINGARALRQDALTGSLEQGKKADFIVIDQNLLQLISSNAADQISDTRVLETVFDGKSIYTSRGTAP